MSVFAPFFRFLEYRSNRDSVVPVYEFGLQNSFRPGLATDVVIGRTTDIAEAMATATEAADLIQFVDKRCANCIHFGFRWGFSGEPARHADGTLLIEYPDDPMDCSWPEHGLPDSLRNSDHSRMYVRAGDGHSCTGWSPVLGVIYDEKSGRVRKLTRSGHVAPDASETTPGSLPLTAVRPVAGADAAETETLADLVVDSQRFTLLDIFSDEIGAKLSSYTRHGYSGFIFHEVNSDVFDGDTSYTVFATHEEAQAYIATLVPSRQKKMSVYSRVWDAAIIGSFQITCHEGSRMNLKYRASL